MDRLSFIEKAVIGLISTKMQIPVDEIERTSTFRSLGIDGDDAAELMQEYADTFEVDMSGFKGSDYYGPEAAYLPLPWRKPPRHKLTVDHLIHVAKNRRWVTPKKEEED